MKKAEEVVAHRCNKVHRAGRIKRSSITTWGPGAAYFIGPRELGCRILFRALGMLSTAKNFHKTAICHLRRYSSLSPCLRSFPFVFVFCNSRPALPPAFSLFFRFSLVPVKREEMLLRGERMHFRSCYTPFTITLKPKRHLRYALELVFEDPLQRVAKRKQIVSYKFYIVRHKVYLLFTLNRRRTIRRKMSDRN